MEITKSGATFSSIVGIGEQLKKLSELRGEEYLFLNRGVNSVCNIDLTEVVKEIDFNSAKIQVYPPNKGMPQLRQAINKEYFKGESTIGNISITAGGMSGLDLILQLIEVETIFFSKYFWGSYAKVATVRNLQTATYDDLSSFTEYVECNIDAPGKCAVIICDPNNPVGDKIEDENLLASIKQLNELGVAVIIDCPYRKLFTKENDKFYHEIFSLKNVIITESFSKSLGLSGQRIGFIHCNNEDFNAELNIRLIYSLNGVNAFAQELVYRLLSTEKGKSAVDKFKTKTVQGISQNIQYLEKHHLLAAEFYKINRPVGIFAVINKTQEELLKHNIGSVSMSYFTKGKNPLMNAFTRICVSVPPEKFQYFFERTVLKNEVEQQ